MDVSPAGSQDFGWSHVGLSRRRSHGCSLARMSVGVPKAERCVRRKAGRSGADRSSAGVKTNTSHRAAGSCGLTKVGREPEMITTSPRAVAEGVRPAPVRQHARCRCRSENNDGHRPRGAGRAEENVRRSAGAPTRRFSRVCDWREIRNTGCGPIAAVAHAAGSGEGTRRHPGSEASRRCHVRSRDSGSRHARR